MRQPMTVWMEVTKDKYELPVAVANSARELARITGATLSNVASAASRNAHGKQKHSRFIKVVVEEEEEVETE